MFAASDPCQPIDHEAHTLHQVRADEHQCGRRGFERRLNRRHTTDTEADQQVPCVFSVLPGNYRTDPADLGSHGNPGGLGPLGASSGQAVAFRVEPIRGDARVPQRASEYPAAPVLAVPVEGEVGDDGCHAKQWALQQVAHNGDLVVQKVLGPSAHSAIPIIARVSGVERYLIPVVGGDPALVTRPKTVRHVVVFHPAPTEPRSGRFGAYAQWSSLWARQGVATVVSDLPGGGDSTGAAHPTNWIRQAEAVREQAHLLAAGRPLHLIARGAATALLPRGRLSGVRIGLSPPRPEECREAAAALRADGPSSTDALASTVGMRDVDPELDGNVAPLLDWAADQLAQVRWDLEFHAGHRPPRASSAVIFSDVDLLARLEITRVGIGHVLAGLFDELTDSANWAG